MGCPQANFNLGNVYRQTGIYEAAEFCYRAVLKSVPNHWRALLNLAVALAGMERTAEAQKCLRKAFKASGMGSDQQNGSSAILSRVDML